MSTSNPFHSLGRRSFADRIARVKGVSVPSVYKPHSPTLRELETYQQLVVTVLEHIGEDGALSDAGKAKRATKDAVLSTIKDLNRAEKTVRAGIHKRQQQRAEIIAKRTPQAPDLGALIRTMIAVALTANDPQAREALLERFLQPGPNGLATPDNAIGLALPPEAFGTAGETRQEALRARIGLVAVGAEGRELDLADHVAGEELKALGELRGAVAACGDLDELVATGAIPKPFALMTHEERVAYSLEHGAEALHELAYRDQELLGGYSDPSPDLTFDDVNLEAPSPLSVHRADNGEVRIVEVAVA